MADASSSCNDSAVFTFSSDASILVRASGNSRDLILMVMSWVREVCLNARTRINQ